MSVSAHINGTVSLAEMQSRLSGYPEYKDNQARDTDRAQAVRKLWGGRLAAIMAGKNASGRYAGAHLECPDTACTGLIELETDAHCMTYANIAAIENILALEDGPRSDMGPVKKRAFTCTGSIWFLFQSA